MSSTPFPAPVQWHTTPVDSMERGMIVAVHGSRYPTISIGQRTDFGVLKDFDRMLIAWCYQADLIAAAQAARKSEGK